MTNELERLKHWHQVCRDPDQTKEQVIELYKKCIVEEYDEYKDAETIQNEVKELGDIVVVAVGKMMAHGADPVEVLKIVNDSNFSKYIKRDELVAIDEEKEYYREVETGLFALHRRSDGKMLKGPKYVKGDAERRIAEHLGESFWAGDYE